MISTSRIVLLLSIGALTFSCNNKKDDQETMLKGEATIYVDQTIAPIIEDQVAVFESDYDAKINLIFKSEAEIVQAIAKDSAKIFILARDLSINERKVFDQRKINPRSAMFATDAIALISNKQFGDTIVTLSDITDFMKGNRTSQIKGLVFDDPNSSTVSYLNNLAKVAGGGDGIYSFKSTNEVVKFVAENKDMIGIVGLNWLTEPSEEIQMHREKINIMSLKVDDNAKAFYPNQNNLAEGKYPLARDLYIVDAQGYSGLGAGFASFIAGQRGQRIVLNSGLLPIRIPSRKILTRTKIETKNNN